jgi:hypothetical protein
VQHFRIQIALLNCIHLFSETEPWCSALASRAFALVNIRPVRAVVMTTLAARKLISVLGMIGANLTRAPNDNLPVLVPESN